MSFDGTKYLVLYGNEEYDFIYNRIRWFIGVKSGITYVSTYKCMLIIMQKSK